jgi:phosphocarrier protein HPr
VDLLYARQTKILNKTGLHARPASAFVMATKQFKSDITVRNVDAGGDGANAKSIIMLLAAGLGCGTTVEVAANGPDEKEAVDHLVALIDSGFGE